MLVLAQPGRRIGRSELRLVAPDAQIPYTAAAAETLRAILREASAADAPPRITGIGRAFHVPGSLPGESETQIFLQTADNRPISLNVLRRPGEQPRWSVALSEIVDDAAAPPQPNSLLWYRLACTLPARLPADALRESGAGGSARRSRPIIGWSWRASAPARARARRAARQDSEAELDADAGAIGIDVGLAGRDAQRGDAAAGGDQIVDLAHERLLQVEAAARARARRSRCAGNHNPRRWLRSSEAAKLGSSTQTSTVTSSRCGLPTSKSWKPMSTGRSIFLEHDLARPRREPVGHEAVQMGRYSGSLGLQELHVARQGEETLAAVKQDRVAGEARRGDDEAQGRDDLIDRRRRGRAR